MKKLPGALFAVALAVLIGFAARTWLFSAVRIAGTSMESTLHSGDIVLIIRSASAPEHGDIVECTFDSRSGTYVKRIIGLPGDSVEYSGGELLLNGRPRSEPYTSSETEDIIITLGPDEYLVLGDNRAESYDSRAEDMGCIRRDQILGRARWILWPISRFGPVE